MHATCEMYARERKKKGKEKLKREKSKNEKGRGDGEWKGNNLFDEYSRFNWLDLEWAQLNELHDVRLIIKDNVISRVNALP